MGELVVRTSRYQTASCKDEIWHPEGWPKTTPQESHYCAALSIAPLTVSNVLVIDVPSEPAAAMITDWNQGSNQAVFDCGCTRFVLEETSEVPVATGRCEGKSSAV